MKLKSYFIKERVIIIWAFIITMLFAMMPLFSVNCIQGHDLAYHLLRIESLKEAILMGTPFLKINVLFFVNSPPNSKGLPIPPTNSILFSLPISIAR